MRRRQGQEVVPARTIHEQTVTLGEEVPLEDRIGAWHIVAIQLQYTLAGEVQKLLSQPPPVFLRLRLADGRTVTYRLIPAMAAAGFLLNPLLEDGPDVFALYGFAAGKRVLGFCVLAEEGTPRAYARELRITITRSADPLSNARSPVLHGNKR
jgi:hypothetical protein